MYKAIRFILIMMILSYIFIWGCSEEIPDIDKIQDQLPDSSIMLNINWPGVNNQYLQAPACFIPQDTQSIKFIVTGTNMNEVSAVLNSPDQNIEVPIPSGPGRLLRAECFVEKDAAGEAIILTPEYSLPELVAGEKTDVSLTIIDEWDPIDNELKSATSIDTNNLASPWHIIDDRTGSIAPTSDTVDYFVFEANENASYSISIEDADITVGTLLLTLYDNRENELVSKSGESPKIAWLAPADGTYYIKVSATYSWSDISAQYRLKIQRGGDSTINLTVQ